MIKTTDKILAGILVLLLVGMGAVFITAVSDEKVEKNTPSSKQLILKEIKTNNGAESVDEANKEDREIEIPATGNALEQASAAALEYIGEGRVTDSEVGDEEGYYEIEITLDNGNEVDVHLDENFKVLSAEFEGETDDD